MDYVLPLLFFFIACIYSSVGLGGGSSYAALMAIFGISYQIIPTTSLILNLLVTFFGMINFWKNGYGRFNLVYPFFLTSIPMTFFASSLDLSKETFELFLLGTLILVVIRIYFIKDLKMNIELNWFQKYIFIVLVGSILGFIAGGIGIGGGIYLVPIIIMFRLGTEKEASAAGAMFIWANSLTGVIARARSGTFDIDFILPLSIAVIIGGIIGSYFGAVRFSASKIQRVMGSVIIFAIVILLKGLL
ncbi:MAG: hypothetical protein CMG14_03230 [Candidatus Marinimicrobia bacterium]|jgi:uncharacterized membrane protein YfcA|nr:hypothetical protein [Candidatus Neomarinimicrobiota bacterium]